jgi:hypothetical protein
LEFSIEATATLQGISTRSKQHAKKVAAGKESLYVAQDTGNHSCFKKLLLAGDTRPSRQQGTQFDFYCG